MIFTSSLNVSTSALPLTYLGLPLSLQRPDRLSFQPLVDKIRRRLAGWKSSLLSRAGRVLLASSVLSTIPVYWMSVFKLPQWVIKEIDAIRRNFIWGSSHQRGRATHLLSWDRVCLPKTFGGFGLLDLRTQNVALLLRWLWRLYNNPNSLWSLFARCFYDKRDHNVPPLAWNSSGSFFWRDLFSFRFFFQLCTRSVIGSGLNTLFWYNDWGASCLYSFFDSSTPPLCRLISLRNAVPVLHTLLPSPLTLQHSILFQAAASFTFTAQQDRMEWKLHASGQYTASSFYKHFISVGKVSFPLNFLWKLKMPPSSKFFLLLLAHGRILTQDQLLKRNIPCTLGCLLCNNSSCETAKHLFLECPFSTCLWQHLGFNLPPILLNPDKPLLDCLLDLFALAANQNHKKTVIATTLWGLWLERNNRTFRQESRRMGSIQHWIIAEATLFMKSC
ncbi:RNA-directed DNA polymerase (reverse transcriptase)-related family protein [Rhynchospora pubera]|uniref:RNA-directed DNA polymerase (Reverse transcriptase)-related family protein n=1 Tax=Rhynchospora pubera TaxID=906938 RepID=A0AAV8H8G0_9POAL|nr:RNA-directed DNA polymerase (reverse transcriptase)-related family protein [Rhynchospora pubera]